MQKTRNKELISIIRQHNLENRKDTERYIKQKERWRRRWRSKRSIFNICHLVAYLTSLVKIVIFVILSIYKNIRQLWHTEITQAHRPGVPAAIIGFSGGFIAWGHLLAIPYLGPGWTSFLTISAIFAVTTATWSLWVLSITRYEPTPQAWR